MSAVPVLPPLTPRVRVDAADLHPWRIGVETALIGLAAGWSLTFALGLLGASRTVGRLVLGSGIPVDAQAAVMTAVVTLVVTLGTALVQALHVARRGGARPTTAALAAGAAGLVVAAALGALPGLATLAVLVVQTLVVALVARRR